MYADGIERLHHDNYRHAVNEVADTIAAELAEEGARCCDRLFARLIETRCGQSEYVTHDDLRAHTLKFSPNSGATAAHAFKADVLDALRRLQLSPESNHCG